MNEDLSTVLLSKQTNKQTNKMKQKKRKQKQKPKLVEKSLNSPLFGLNGDSFHAIWLVGQTHKSKILLAR